MFGTYFALTESLSVRFNLCSIAIKNDALVIQIFGLNSLNQVFKPGGATISNKSGDGLSSLLIIEDALIHSTIISRVGERMGFSTTTARSYAEAAMLLQERVFDCITLDLGLGRHAGVEVLHLLSVIESKAPILIISGSEHAVCEETVNIGKSLGLNICEPVRKPLDLKILHATLAKMKNRSL